MLYSFHDSYHLRKHHACMYLEIKEWPDFSTFFSYNLWDISLLWRNMILVQVCLNLASNNESHLFFIDDGGTCWSSCSFDQVKSTRQIKVSVFIFLKDYILELWLYKNKNLILRKSISYHLVFDMGISHVLLHLLTYLPPYLPTYQTYTVLSWAD